MAAFSALLIRDRDAASTMRRFQDAPEEITPFAGLAD